MSTHRPVLLSLVLVASLVACSAKPGGDAGATPSPGPTPAAAANLVPAESVTPEPESTVVPTEGQPGPTVIVGIPKYAPSRSMEWQSPEGTTATPGNEEVPNLSRLASIAVFFGASEACASPLAQGGPASFVLIDHPSGRDDVVITDVDPTGRVVNMSHCPQASPGGAIQCNTPYPQTGPDDKFPPVFFEAFDGIFTDATPPPGKPTICMVRITS